jgi:hypothetical protein
MTNQKELRESKKIETDILNLFGYWKNVRIEDLLPKDRGLVRNIALFFESKLQEQKRELKRRIEKLKVKEGLATEYNLSDAGQAINDTIEEILSILDK